MFVTGQFRKRTYVPRRQDLRHLHRMHSMCEGLPSRCTWDGPLGRV